MRVALLGFGRFGRALGALLDEAGLPYRALDPSADVPPRVRAPSAEALASGADVVVLAVPVPAMGEAARALAPHLSPKQWVMDVGSVKVAPREALAASLGARVPHVGSHPLFGPTSLALAERPLRVVVCPGALHPGLEERARAFWEDLGCEVLVTDAEAHDRHMAMTHVLAFFVAKGLLEVGAGEGAPFSPPSFQAIARTIDVVRGDAGHLFSAIQRENPFARGAREKLLASLGDVHRTLAAPPPAGEASDLSISDLGERAPDLRETRDLIDALDDEILGLLARRASLARRAGLAKARAGAPPLDPAREAAVLTRRRQGAAEAGLPAEEVESVFRAIIALARRVQASS